MDKQLPRLTEFIYPGNKHIATIEEIEEKLIDLRNQYKANPTTILMIRGKLMKYALELKLKKTNPQKTLI